MATMTASKLSTLLLELPGWSIVFLGGRIGRQPILDGINLLIPDGILLPNRTVLVSGSNVSSWVEILSGMSREPTHPGWNKFTHPKWNSATK
jgi:hypothetical protein